MSSNTLNKQTRELVPFSGSKYYVQGDGISIDGSEINVDLKSSTPSSLTATTNSSTANREYPVEMDANGNLAVNVPWTNTTKGNGITTNAKKTGSAQSSITTSINANTTMDNAIGTLLDNDSTLNNALSNKQDAGNYATTTSDGTQVMQKFYTTRTGNSIAFQWVNGAIQFLIDGQIVKQL